MKTRISFATVAALAFFVSSSAGLGADPDPIEILKKADTATKAVKAVSYTAEVYLEGTIQANFPKIQGTVRAQEIPGQTIHKMSIEATRLDQRLRVTTDGKEIISLNTTRKVAIKGKLPVAARLMGIAGALWMQEFLHPTPFSDELNGESAKHEGIKEIGGVQCDVIYVVYAGGQSRSRWYFGREDHLPRRVDRILQDGKSARVLAVTSLQADPKFDPAAFAPTIPEGYEVEEFRGPPPRPELLAVGGEAPNWTLKTPDGTAVSLKSLRGKVVVLDFWATWCGPCKMAMPGIQKLHEKFEGKPVAVFGVNCWERGDPAAFMKESKYTYGLLLKGDDVAKEYRVSGIPTFYVIGPDGKIFHRASGFNPALEQTLGKIIQDALPKRKRLKV